ncbi:Uncharacterized protein Adt_04705 [Abeliophyllum distichum]|uniref:Uncharacterized protein n=1 Tax=Abeliophyllum distichum TaxID=126358 RepID=A0ABD1V209_9LAMI
MVILAVMNSACSFVLDGELYNTLLGFEENLEKTGEETLTSTEANLKAYLKAVIDEVRQAKNKMTEATTDLEKVKEEWAAARDSIAEMKTKAKAVRAYKQNFPSTPEYSCLNVLFINAGEDRLTKD